MSVSFAACLPILAARDAHRHALSFIHPAHCRPPWPPPFRARPQPPCAPKRGPAKHHSPSTTCFPGTWYTTVPVPLVQKSAHTPPSFSYLYAAHFHALSFRSGGSPAALFATLQGSSHPDFRVTSVLCEEPQARCIASTPRSHPLPPLPAPTSLPFAPACTATHLSRMPMPTPPLAHPPLKPALPKPTLPPLAHQPVRPTETGLYHHT